jgi:hypothetical protein
MAAGVCVSQPLNLSLLSSTYGAPAGRLGAHSASNSAAALQAQISTDQLQLNDWVTCVSASTPKGKAEIAALSGRISAAKEHIARIRATEAAGPAAPSSPAQLAAPTVARSGRVDLWA